MSPTFNIFMMYIFLKTDSVEVGSLESRDNCSDEERRIACMAQKNPHVPSLSSLLRIVPNSVNKRAMM